MRIGIPRETKNHEYRVALTPAGVRELHLRGHEVLVETNAGAGSSFTDDEYVTGGARIVPDAAEVWGEAELMLKVKEPTSEEYQHLHSDLTLFTYLHLAASRETTTALTDAGVNAVAYEMVQSADGRLPLLAPMSEVAGALAPQIASHTLIKSHGGRGILFGGVTGVHGAEVVIIGAGVSGMRAAQIAAGMQARVVLLDNSIDALHAADRFFRGAVQTVYSTTDAVERAVATADVVIGAVLVPGAKAPRVVTNEMVAAMKPGSVLIDIAVDQGGCFEDTRPTSHDEPTYVVHDSVFYAVSNIPGAVPVTSTAALTNATLPYAVLLAERGFDAAVSTSSALAGAVNIAHGQLVAQAVAEAHDLEWRPLAD
ncbi:alanine dehydrogenase [Blastococcus sp. Marseille-P5729]|uniref:alanine dehydrogenase n=1 Tax=Blastococcus sp. Marseille-P5729 TaxID=2086582 RepID=UPI000D1024B7|nr:alanine dehydrogenase [Blastococcus sp. Marseille-P5729]